MNLDTTFEGTVAVVTGAGRGIGRATAIQLARQGAAVMVCARNREAIERTVDEIIANGGRAASLAADVSHWSDVRALAAQTGRVFGPSDVVIANAAVVGPLGHVWELDPKEWGDSIAVNLYGAFCTARAFLPQMRERGRGVLVFLSSGLAVEPMAGFSAYSAGKAGLEQLVRTLAVELSYQRQPIRVHGVYPGIVDTAMQAELRGRDPARFPEAARFKEYHARGWLRPPEEAADFICWLASPAAADLHGKIVSVNDAAALRQARPPGGRPRGLTRR